MFKKRKKQKKYFFDKERAKKPRRFILSEQSRKWILGVLAILFAVIVVLSFFDKAGIAGRIFMKSFTFFIGRTVFLFPLLLLLAAITILNSKIREFLFPVILGIFILILGITGLLGSLDIARDPTLQKFIWNYSGRGGWLGYLMSFPLIKIFGIWVSGVIFFAVIVIGALILIQMLGKKEKEIATKEKPLITKLFKEMSPPKFKVKEITPSSKAKKPLDLDLKTRPIEEHFKVFKISEYQLPPLNLLEKDKDIPNSGDIKTNSAIIKKTFQDFGISVEMAEVNIGPTVTQYTLKPPEGVKLSKITALSNNLALALAVHPIRIEAPIPGRSLVGIEVPNKVRALVRLRNLIENPVFQNSVSNLTIALGQDVAGNPVFADLRKMPHLLIAGSTGTGKTICLNNIILSFLYQNSPESLRFILIDPKRVEFPVYNDLPHLLCPVISDANQAVNALKWLIGEMERRFQILSELKAKDIISYNQAVLEKSKSSKNKNKSKEEEENLEPIPYIVLVIDELADLMAARGKEIEAGIVRLAQMARAVGIHLVVATQRPSVEVITGLIKANITARITFQVASQVDSRTVLDTAGAEKLLGLGDMLFISAEVAKPKRVQSAYTSEKEVKKVANYIKSKVSSSELGGGIEGGILENSLAENLEKGLEAPSIGVSDFYEEDPLYNEAKRVVIEARKASASLLQRRLRIGYARAARLLDILEERGVVGPAEGAKPRQVYIDEGETVDGFEEKEV